MTWAADDRHLYWEQRALDAAQEDAQRKMEERKTALRAQQKDTNA